MSAGATGVNIFDMTYGAYGDMRSNQFCLVEFQASEIVQICSATTAVCCGILQNNPNSGQEAVVRHLGLSKLECTSTAVGALVGPDAAGRGVTKSVVTSGTYYCAQVVQPCSASSRATVVVMPAPVHTYK